MIKYQGQQRERDQLGRFLPGNKASLLHGIYARRLPIKIRREGAKVYLGIVADLGGEDNLTEAQRVLSEKAAGLYQITRAIEEYLLKYGIVKKQRMNPALDVYAKMVSALRRTLRDLGIDKKQSKEFDLATYVKDTYGDKKKAADGAEQAQGSRSQLKQ